MPGTRGRTRSADRGCPRLKSRLTPPTCSLSARVTSGVIKVPPRVRSLPFSTLVSAGTVSRATPEPTSGEGAMMSTGGNVTDTGSAVSEGAGCARTETQGSTRKTAKPTNQPKSWNVSILVCVAIGDAPEPLIDWRGYYCPVAVSPTMANLPDLIGIISRFSRNDRISITSLCKGILTHSPSRVTTGVTLWSWRRSSTVERAEEV